MQPPDAHSGHQSVEFASEAEFRAWAREHVAEGEAFADSVLAQDRDVLA
jgi:hypothetical protein